MQNIWTYLKNIFNEAEESSPSRPFIHETITRSETEQKAYMDWKENLERHRLVNRLGDEYATHRIDPEKVDRALDFLDTPSMKGFVIHAPIGNYTLAELKYLMDYLKERTLTADYRIYLSDRRIYQRNKKQETVERHYLKPKTTVNDNEQINQRFGNIRIELMSRNDEAVNLKFSATGYSDRLFEEAEDFRVLMSILTG